MPLQIELDKKYIEMAKCWSQLSKARRNKVGCLIVKNGSIISDGYNGMPRGFDNNCEIETEEYSMLASQAYRLVTRPEVLHAESNAITKLAKSTQSSSGATLYTTASPCVECSKLIIQSDISRVVYHQLYRDDQGILLLKKSGINVEECAL
jgi:dCMP deaminase